MADLDNQFEAIEASDVALSENQGQKPQPATFKQAPTSKPGLSAKLLYRYLIATTILVVAALSIVFWQKFQRPPASETITNTVSAEADTPPTPATGGRSPGSDAALREQKLRTERRAAQDSLAGIIEKSEFLDAHKVMLWAEADYRAARKQAEQGDSLYQKARFQQATEAYRASLKQLSALEDRIAPLLRETLAKGATAINQGDIDNARQAYTLALALDPDNATAETGLERLVQLPQVLELLSQADHHLTTGAYKQALASFEKALELDSVNAAAKKGLEQATNLLRDKNFNDLLNQGFAHLQAASYPAAIAAFERALKLLPNSASARQALSQARSEYNQQRIGTLLQEAGRLEQQEQWQDAVTAYKAALAIDNSVVDATVGLARSQARADLDQALDALIQEPLRLSSQAVYRQAERLLADARQLGTNSPRLARQIQQVGDLLVVATTPKIVQLISDNKTSVTILRVAALGKFSEKQVELKPGNYVAEGIRKGYRDVRIPFTVTGSGISDAVEVACREAI